MERLIARECYINAHDPDDALIVKPPRAASDEVASRHEKSRASNGVKTTYMTAMAGLGPHSQDR